MQQIHALSAPHQHAVAAAVMVLLGHQPEDSTEAAAAATHNGAAECDWVWCGACNFTPPGGIWLGVWRIHGRCSSPELVQCVVNSCVKHNSMLRIPMMLLVLV
jgi:hypothetical protein